MSGIMDSLKVMAKRLSPQEWAYLQKKLLAGEDVDLAEDMPPPFPGRPTPGGSPLGAQDSRSVRARLRASAKAEASFLEHFPEAERITRA